MNMFRLEAARPVRGLHEVFGNIPLRIIGIYFIIQHDVVGDLLVLFEPFMDAEAAIITPASGHVKNFEALFGEFVDEVNEQAALHTGNAVGTGFFLVGENRDVGVNGILGFNESGESRIGAYAVVVTVCADEPAAI